MVGGGICKLVPVVRPTPPSLITESLEYFDDDACHCLALPTTVECLATVTAHP